MEETRQTKATEQLQKQTDHEKEAHEKKDKKPSLRQDGEETTRQQFEE